MRNTAHRRMKTTLFVLIALLVGAVFHRPAKAQMLMLELPDDALRAVAEDAGAKSIDIEGTSHLEDKRVATLTSPIRGRAFSRAAFIWPRSAKL